MVKGDGTEVPGTFERPQVVLLEVLQQPGLRRRPARSRLTKRGAARKKYGQWQNEEDISVAGANDSKYSRRDSTRKKKRPLIRKEKGPRTCPGVARRAETDVTPQMRTDVWQKNLGSGRVESVG